MNVVELNQIVVPDIQRYLNLLMSDFEASPDYLTLVNQLFFPGLSASELLNRYKRLEISGFEYFKYPASDKYCSFEALDNIEHDFHYVNMETQDSYKFFEKKDFINYEDAKASYPKSYFFIKKTFDKIFDDFIIDKLGGFRKEGAKTSVYSKLLYDDVYVILDIKKANARFTALNNYFFPDLKFKIAGREFSFLNYTDLRSLLFLPWPSFHFFYLNTNDVVLDGKGRLVSATRKTGEPVIYHNEQEGIFTISNSYDNLKRYNKYLYFIAELFVHYYKIFEIWLSDCIKANASLLR